MHIIHNAEVLLPATPPCTCIQDNIIRIFTEKSLRMLKNWNNMREDAEKYALHDAIYVNILDFF